ncbi:MAG: methyltransferase domain-containing protein, partial [Bacteroidota bacterium]
MKSPLSHRNGIPFFCHKSAKDFQRDVYERYDEMVVRQSALHLADQLWKSYPMQRVLDFAASYYTSAPGQHIAEVGCGVGRWIAHIAQTLPLSNCWGIDYSYQMLRRANEFWRLGKEVTIDLSSKGVGGLHLK